MSYSVQSIKDLYNKRFYPEDIIFHEELELIMSQLKLDKYNCFPNEYLNYLHKGKCLVFHLNWNELYIDQMYDPNLLGDYNEDLCRDMRGKEEYYKRYYDELYDKYLIPFLKRIGIDAISYSKRSIYNHNKKEYVSVYRLYIYIDQFKVKERGVY